MTETWENQDVSVQDLPPIAETTFQYHPIRYRKYRFVVSAMLWFLPAIGYGFIAYNAPWLASTIIGGVLLALVFLSVIGILKGYKKRSYALREKDLTYRKGWLFTSTTTIPFNRIQHTEVSQGPLERKFDLCSLKIYTAGGSTSDLSIPGLENDEAQVLRDFIAQKAASYV